MFENVTEDQFSDLFGGELKTQEKPFGFTGGEEQQADLFHMEQKEEEKKEEVQEVVDDNGDTDILDTPVVEVKKDFTDIDNYFKKKFESKQLIQLVDEETGKPLELKTQEDYDMVLEQNINHKVEEAKKDLNTNWYASKSPAWKAIAQYAEYVDDPTQIIPFLQGVENIQSVAGLDENVIEDAEQIVRYQKQLTGTPDDVIEEEIEALKTTDKLISNAAKIKPVLLQKEQQRLADMQKDAEKRDLQYWQTVEQYELKAREAIEKPFFGKQKLKKDEMASIYDLIAVPQETTGGYAIYNKIDSLYESKDFETLREIALLLSKKDSFYKYASQGEREKVAEGAMKKFRLQTENVGSNQQMDEPEERQPVIKMNKTGFRFGR